MNWKTYKSLTPKLKEEYNYRFKDKNHHGFIGWFFIFIVLGCMTFTTMSLALVMMTHEAFVDVRIYVEGMLINFVKISAMFGWIFLAVMVGDIIGLIKTMFCEWRWRKKNNIKSKFKWWWQKDDK